MATEAAIAIVKLGTNARPAIPIFLRDLQSPNHFVRERAADALGNLHIEPTTVVPALTNLFGDLSTAAVCLSLRSLGAFEAEALPAAHAISLMLEDPNENVRLRPPRRRSWGRGRGGERGRLSLRGLRRFREILID